ncbi:MAG: hypothetical protein Q4B09_11555 [Lachnospiraceae bacterium]|nr:hypothetical protein [Lachnospiraceae bacterium]
MKLFSAYSGTPGSGHRLTGLSRFTELLERDFKRLYLVNLLTLLLCLPYLLGAAYAVLSSSLLVMLAAGILGGALAGPAIACLYDAVLRSLRDAKGSISENYRRAWTQNARSAVLPGIIFGTVLGIDLFMFALFLWASSAPGIGTVLIYILGLLLVFLIMTIFWPLLVLFDQPLRDRLRNCLLFSVKYFWKMLGCALLQLIYWAVFIVLLPWSSVILLLTGFWFIIFLTCFLLYDTLNETFSIEEKIAQAYPEQVPFYEDDETWLKRKMISEDGPKPERKDDEEE